MKNTMNRSTIRLLPYLMLAIMITFTACEGPSGTDGEKGSKGDAGAIGPAGEDGSMIYADTGAPTTSIGTEGDYYLDNSTGELYGPKDGSGWGSPNIVLMGNDGQDGSQIHSGTGAPDPAMGATGDFYLDKSSYELYGPKTGSGWGMALNLKGADGNANVTRYMFGEHDFGTSSFWFHSIPVSFQEMQQSAWIFYLVKKSTNSTNNTVTTNYYPLPGSGYVGGSFYDPYYYNVNNSSTSKFRINDSEGSGGSYDRVEIVRIEASNTEDKTKKVGKTTVIPKDLDTSNYREVAKYYGFGDGNAEMNESK